jgi:hypothetical protein
MGIFHVEVENIATGEIAVMDVKASNADEAMDIAEEIADE